MKSKTLIKKQLGRKTNPELVDTIRNSIKNEKWIAVARILSGSSGNQSSVNLDEIEKNTKAGETVVVPGRVLSNGELSKKVRICALGISNKAIEKLKETKSEFVTILDEIKKNPKAEGIKLIR